MSAGYTSSVQYNRNLCSLGHIRSAGYDLQQFILSDIYLTDHKLIRIRMTLDLLDLSDHDLVKVGIHLLISLTL